jgi:hypothetical protein
MQDEPSNQPLAKAITPRFDFRSQPPIAPNSGRNTSMAIAFSQKQSPQKIDPGISPGRSTKTGLQTKCWQLSAVA